MEITRKALVVARGTALTVERIFNHCYLFEVNKEK